MIATLYEPSDIESIQRLTIDRRGRQKGDCNE